MKTSIMLTLMAAVMLPTVANAVEPADTIQSIINPDRVIVTRDGDRSNIVITGTKDNPGFYYSYTTEVGDNNRTESDWDISLPFLKSKKKSRTECIWGENVYIGATMPVNQPHGLNGSIEFGIEKIVGMSISTGNHGPQFAIGLGIHYRQYTLHHSQIFAYDNHRLSIVDAPTADVSSRLRNFGFQVPLTIYQPFCNGIGLTVGAAAVFNTYTRASSRVTIDGVEYSNNFKGLHQRLLTADIFAVLGWKNNLGLYVRYSPMSLFAKEWGPQFNTLSFGVSLAM